MAFNLIPDLTDMGCFHLIKKESIRLKVKFSASLAAPINTIVYSEFDSSIRWDKNRRVLTDYFIA